MTCDEGQVCVERISASGGTAPVDTGPTDAGVFAECVARPPECASQGDCMMSSCSQLCADAVCEAIPGYTTVMLTVSEGGRVYRCVRAADAA
jgi:hypothetical protein